MSEVEAIVLHKVDGAEAETKIRAVQVVTCRGTGYWRGKVVKKKKKKKKKNGKDGRMLKC